jgi:isoleucyl-tRNA synthetase
MMGVKTEVNKLLEKARNEKTVGSSLSAEVILYVDGDLSDDLNRLEDELRFVILTSKVTVKAFEASSGEATAIEGLRVSVTASADPKCDRCWHHREDVGSHKKHETLCGRCVENIDGEGEKRSFA